MQPSTMPPPAQELLGHLSAKADAGDGLAWLVASPLFKKNRESVIYRQTEKVLPVKYHEVSSWISIVDIFTKMAPCWMKHGCAMEKLSRNHFPVSIHILKHQLQQSEWSRVLKCRCRSDWGAGTFVTGLPLPPRLAHRLAWHRCFTAGSPL